MQVNRLYAKTTAIDAISKLAASNTGTCEIYPFPWQDSGEEMKY
jgi:hypothetical protein